MGADKPQILKQEDTKTQKSYVLLFMGAAIVLVAIAIISKLSLSGEEETPQLNLKDQKKLEKRLKEIDNAEQYALIANENEWYPCNHSGRGTFYLLAGDVWKYGVTTKGQFGRYRLSYLEDVNVSYIIQFQGTIAECMKEEQRKLFHYPYLPENLARPVKNRLPRPPFNSKMQ